MAFGKKNTDAPTPDATADEPLEPEAALDESSPPDDVAAEEPEAAPAEAPTAAPAAPSSDALLSMFQETKAEVDDLAVLTDLAGETDIDDILEELRTLRAALGITDIFEEDLAA